MAILVALLVVPAGLRGLLRAGHVRVNYRERRLAFPLGAVLVTAALVALAPLAVLDERGGLDLLDPELRQWIVYLVGIAFLGLLDDSLGMGSSPDTPRGWRGHASAVLRGELSTGAVKAVGALALAAYVVTGTGNEWLDYLTDIALLILVTNAFNLLDLRGGRVEKTMLLLVVALLPRRLDPGTDRVARHIHRTIRRRSVVHAGRAGDARRHRFEPGRCRGRHHALDRAGRNREVGGIGNRVGDNRVRGIPLDFEIDREASASPVYRLRRES